MEAKFFLASQKEGLQVGGTMSYCSLAEPGTGLGGVGPHVLCSVMQLNGRGLKGHGRFLRGGSEKLRNQIRVMGEAGQAQA